MAPKRRNFKFWADYVIMMHNDGEVPISNDPLPLSTHFIHPGLTFSMFQRDDHPGIPDILKYLTEVRNIIFFTNCGPDGINFLDFLKIYKARLMFVTSSEVEIKGEFYDSAIAKWPLKVTLSLNYVGNSSFTIGVKLSVPSSEMPLVIQNSSYVMVDKERRRPAPLPDWFKEKFKKRAFFTEGCRVETLTKPSKTFHKEIKVFWSHTDVNDHTNYSSYVGFVLDSLRAAMMDLTLKQKQRQHSPLHSPNPSIDQGAPYINCDASKSYPIQGLRGISPDVLKNGVKAVRICYSKESNEGDLLDVHLWQEEGDDLVVKAIVERRGEILCHIHLEYYSVASHL